MSDTIPVYPLTLDRFRSEVEQLVIDMYAKDFPQQVDLILAFVRGRRPGRQNSLTPQQVRELELEVLKHRTDPFLEDTLRSLISDWRNMSEHEGVTEHAVLCERMACAEIAGEARGQRQDSYGAACAHIATAIRARGVK
jgi:hypothetical protein